MLAADLLFLRSLELDMIGVGRFCPTGDAAGDGAGRVAGAGAAVCRMLAFAVPAGPDSGDDRVRDAARERPSARAAGGRRCPDAERDAGGLPAAI